MTNKEKYELLKEKSFWDMDYVVFTENTIYQIKSVYACEEDRRNKIIDKVILV